MLFLKRGRTIVREREKLSPPTVGGVVHKAIRRVPVQFRSRPRKCSRRLNKHTYLGNISHTVKPYRFPDCVKNTGRGGSPEYGWQRDSLSPHAS